MEDEILLCPDCGGDDLLIYSQTAWHLNTCEFFCHAVKTHDDCAKVTCQANYCGWAGTLAEIKKHNSDKKGQS